MRNRLQSLFHLPLGATPAQQQRAHSLHQLFVGISWGSDRVLAQTKNIADRLGLNTDYLTTLNDIDRPEDLSIWEKYDRQAK